MAFTDPYNEFLRRPPRAGQTPVTPVAPEVVRNPPLNVVGLTQGWTPDYKSLIASDPSYLAYQNASTLDVNQAAARRRAALQALVTRYGGVGNFKDPYGDIDQGTRELAERNQFSDTDRLQRNYEQGIDMFQRALAARRGIRSGELQYGLDQRDQARGAAEYDLGQEYANAYQSIVNNYLGVESGARRGEVSALSQAMANVYSDPANRPTEGTEATLVPDWESQYGKPVYQGPDGKLYEIGPDGNPIGYSPPSVEPTPPPTTTGTRRYLDPTTNEWVWY